jgi:hypothetical protein
MLLCRLAVLVWQFVPNPKVSVLDRPVEAAEVVDPKPVRIRKEKLKVKIVVFSFL